MMLVSQYFFGILQVERMDVKVRLLCYILSVDCP